MTWKQIGECEGGAKEYMHSKCQLSCGLCTPDSEAAAPAAAVEDAGKDADGEEYEYIDDGKSEEQDDDE